jgi:hypothetical protein
MTRITKAQREASAGNSLSGYWRLPCKPLGSRAVAEPFDGDALSGELPEQLEGEVARNEGGGENVPALGEGNGSVPSGDE